MSDNFRLQAKNIFATYPQCSLPLSVASNLIRDFFQGNLEYAILSQEAHADGSLHLHVVIVLRRAKHYRDSRFLDLEHDDNLWHGNYQAARNLKDVVNYVLKNNNQQVVGINCNPRGIQKALNQKKSTKCELIANLVMEGEDLMQINLKYPGYLMMHFQKIMTYKRWHDNVELLATPRKKFRGCLQFDRMDPSRTSWELQIVKWINLNFSLPRKHRQPQLWIHGQTSTGKTHLIMQLLEYFQGYYVPNDGNWYDGYTDQYDFIYFDEFKGHKTIQDMNRLVEGSPCPLPQRGTQPYVKKKNLPVIVASNYGIQGVYQKADSIVVAALQSRFLEIEVPASDRIELQFEFDGSDEDLPDLFQSESEEADEEPFEGPESKLQCEYPKPCDICD